MEKNRAYLGDCLNLFDQITNESIDLIYLDPPFFTQKTQRQITRDGNTSYSFQDTWENIGEFKQYIKDRLEKAKLALKDTGSIFLHCDRSASHHFRCALEEVFGAENFQSEIIWSYRRWSNAKKGLLNTHQTIFFYSKSKNFKFNQFYEAYSPTTNLDQILQERSRDDRGKSVYKTNENGEHVLIKDKKGVPLSDVWEIPYLNPKARERVNYPTQKPILLLEKIIELVTDKGDLVLDPFCGSGTTLVAAKLLDRNYIGFDQSKEALELVESRLLNPIKSESDLMKKGIEKYVNQDSKTTEILNSLGALVVQRNKGIDGFIRTGDELVPVKIKKSDESVSEAKKRLILASRKNQYSKKVLIVHDNECEENVMSFEDDDVLIFKDHIQLASAFKLNLADASRL